MIEKENEKEDFSNMTYEELCCYGNRVLHSVGIEDADYDSVELLLYLLGESRTFFLLNKKNRVPDDKIEAYKNLIEKRKKHIPLQHITGTASFYGYDFKVNENVLIPRQDTECVVEYALKKIEDTDCLIMDMCTGSGCIGITIALKKASAKVLAYDISAAALEVAKENAKKLEAYNIEFLNSDLFVNVSDDRKFDMIVSNPPYIATKEIDKLTEEVKNHDPMLALDGFEDGLFFYRQITKNAVDYLKKDGYLIYEIGFDQGESVKNLMIENGFYEVTVLKDLAGLDRIVSGRLK